MLTAAIRKYQKTLMLVVSVGVILSFVVYFSPGRKGVSLSGDVNIGTIDGQPISKDSYVQARDEAYLRYRIYYGRWPNSDSMSRQMGFDEDQEIASRLLLLHRLKELKVHASEEEMATWIASTFRDRNKAFNPEAYNQFVAREIVPHGISKVQFQTYIAHEIGIQHLAAVEGVTGKLITPREAESLYRRQNEQYVAEACFFSFSNYLASVEVTPAALSQYYSNNLASYRIPDRLIVDYVKFPIDKYVDEASKELQKEPTFQTKVDEMYAQRGTNAFTDANGVPNNEVQAKEKIKFEFQMQVAKALATKQANNFVMALSSEADSPGAFAKLAATNGLTVLTTPPFVGQEGPKELPDGALIGDAASELNEEGPLSPAVPGTNSVYVLHLKQRIPSEIQAFEQVREKVTTDYRRTEALKAARKAGNDFHTTVTNLVAQGKTFADACSAAKLTALQIQPFSRSTQTLPELENRASLTQVKNIAFSLEPGKSSGFNYSADGGFVLHVKSILPTDEAKMKSEMSAFIKTLQRSQQYEAFSEWFRKERDKVKLAYTKSKNAAN